MESKSIFENSGISVIDDRAILKDREDYKEKVEIKKPLLYISRGDVESAVKAGIVPEAYKHCDFSIEKIKENQRQQYRSSSRKFIIYDFEKYSDVTQGIISTIIANKIPEQSYIIGAPNGFGKTSFVNSCLLKLHALGRMCTPYISLTELANVRLADERRLLNGIGVDRYYSGKTSEIEVYSREEYDSAVYSDMDKSNYTKKPINIINKFSWSEYMNCDILFCYFTNVSAKLLESEILKTAVTTRGVKGLPTIVMISTSLNPYKNDQKLAEYVWNELLTYKHEPSYDRLKHVSCYKDYNAPLRTALGKE